MKKSLKIFCTFNQKSFFFTEHENAKNAKWVRFRLGLGLDDDKDEEDDDKDDEGAL